MIGSRRYATHPGRHEWSLPVAELAGKRVCRNCGHIAKGREDFFDVQRARRKQEVTH
jgi:hypothetical protein